MAADHPNTTTPSPHNQQSLRNHNHSNGSSIVSHNKLSLPLPPPTALRSRSDSRIIVLKTEYYGRIRIRLRPDWSRGSVEYLYQLVEHHCARCQFYRKSKGNRTSSSNYNLLLGVMANYQVPLNTEPGPASCPPEGLVVVHVDASADKNHTPCDDVWNHQKTDDPCDCHGPTFQAGMVAWVEGAVGGPDFVLHGGDDKDQEERPLLGTHYTVFGQLLEDQSSYDVVQRILKRPTAFHEAKVLVDRVHFELELE
jgi:hypothetical protein